MREWNLLHGNFLLPEVVRYLRLQDSIWREVRVSPDVGSIATQFSPSDMLELLNTRTARRYYVPVAVPGWRAVKALCSIVVSFTMTAEEEDLVHRVQGSCSIQCVDMHLELLPLRQIGRNAFCGWVRAIDQPEVV